MEMRTSSTTNEDCNDVSKLTSFLPMDLDSEEDEVLRRYESVFKALVSYGACKELTTRLTERDPIQGTIADFATCHALQGSSYIDEIQMNMQYTVLQSALILTISMPLYIDPPGFNKVDNVRVFSAVIGLAAMTQITVIIGCTIISALLNRPYTSADTMVARVQSNTLMVVVTFINYVANIATLVAMLIAGFDRSSVDGAVQTYVGVLAIALIYMMVIATRQGNAFQDRRSLAFYNKYCETSGRLKPEYLRRVYEKKE